MVKAFAAELETAKAFIERRYCVDSSQRLEVGKSSAPTVPRFVLLRTRLGCLWRFRADLSSELIGELAKLAGREGAAVPPLELSPPAERLEPMLQVLRRAGLETAAVRELLLCRPGWGEGVATARLGVDEAEPVADARLGTLAWEQRGLVGELEAGDWDCFGDIVVFVDV